MQLASSQTFNCRDTHTHTHTHTLEFKFQSAENSDATVFQFNKLFLLTSSEYRIFLISHTSMARVKYYSLNCTALKKKPRLTGTV